MRTAVYAGSFDPITNGHLWMVEEGAKLFDELVVAIGENPSKKYTFTLDERLDMLRDATRHVTNVTTATFTNAYLVHYAKGIGAQYILRGVRNSADYTYEHTMRHINEDLGKDITSVFLMPPRGIAEVSSSMVKGLIGPQGWEATVSKYVPAPVLQKLLTRFGNAAVP